MEKKILTKKNYLILLYTVTAACILIGCCRKLFLRQEETGNVKICELDPSTFTSIQIDASVMDLEINSSSEALLSYTDSEALPLAYDVKGGVLVISQTTEKKLWNTHTEGASLTITLPEDVALESVSAAANVGDIDLRGISADSITLQAELGDIDLHGISADSITLQAELGDVDMESCVFDALTVTADLGDVAIFGSAELSDYAMRLDAELGGIQVCGLDQGNSYTQAGSGTQEIHITVSLGGISVEY